MNHGFKADQAPALADLSAPPTSPRDDLVIYVVSRSPERRGWIQSLAPSGELRWRLRNADRLESAMAENETNPAHVCVADWPPPDPDLTPRAVENFCPIIALLDDPAVADILPIRAGAVDCLRVHELNSETLSESILRAAKRQASRAAVQSELRQMRRIFDSSADGVALIDGEGLVRVANPRAMLILGGPSGEVMYKPCPFEWGGRTQLEFEFTRADGLQGVAEIHLIETECDGGPGRLACMREITERKSAERRLVESQARIKALTSQLLRADHRERRRIAAGLHDEVAQLLIGLKLQHEILARRLPDDPQNQKTIELLSELTQKAIRATRNLVFDLVPPALYQSGFRAALEDLVDQMSQRYGLTVQLSLPANCQDIGVDLANLAYQAIRESLMNVVKHAGVDVAQVRCAAGEGVFVMEITDHGAGFDPERLKGDRKDQESETKPGFGFFTLRERFEQIGGGFEIESQPGKGTVVRLWAPLQQAPSDAPT